MNKKVLPFSYYGGKFSHLNFLLPIINNTEHDCFTDNCGGSGSVVSNKISSKIDVYNDTYGEVVNFFRVLRENKDKLIEQIALTPYSREEYNDAIDGTSNDKWEKIDPIEAARLFFIKARMTMNCTSSIATKGNFRIVKTHSRRGMASVVSMYLTAIDGLDKVAQIFLTTIIEQLDCVVCAYKYDTPKTLHYFDPPYPKETRTGGKGYKHDSTDKIHQDIFDACIGTSKQEKLVGKIIVSSYENPLYSSALLPNGFTIIKAKPKSLPSTVREQNERGVNLRQEVVYVNFPV